MTATRPPRLNFHGAARAVTGSCFRLQTEAGDILVDCGMFQGSKTEKELNYRPFPFEPSKIAAVVLTHAHIDHSGLLPKLVREGFKGPVFATTPTVDLCSVMLPDSAHIQAFEVEQFNRRAEKRGRGRVSAIYDDHDVKNTLKAMRPVSYGVWFQVLKGVRARLWNAGHMLGSASVEIELDQPGKNPLRLCFSGDIGPDHKLLHADPEAPSGVDYLICESTYGGTDRIDKSPNERRSRLRDEVHGAMQNGGALIIPSFAVERAQELIADLGRLMADGDLPTIPVYVDSPLATRATKVFVQHKAELEDGDRLLASLKSRWLNFSQTAEQSRALDRLSDFHIVIAASGMCEAGRIRHRLRNWLWRDEATVLFVGDQAEGTLGQLLQSGAKQVRIQGDEIAVRARIRTLDLYSGHADGPEIADWISARMPIAKGLFLVHGEPPALEGLTARIGNLLSPEQVVVPVLDAAYDLTSEGVASAPDLSEPRIKPEQVAKLDWHNDVSRLFLDLNEALLAAPDENARGVLIRRLRKALEDQVQPEAR